MKIEKLKAPLFRGPVGAGATNDWYIIVYSILTSDTRDKTLGGPGGIDAGLSALSRPDVTVDSAVMGVPVPGSAVMDVPVPGSAVSLSVLSSPDVTVDSSVMGLPVPVPGSAISLPAVPGSAISLPAVPGSAISLPAVPGSAISLPALGLTSDNMATSQEPEVSFISTLNVNPTVDVGFSDGAVLTSTNLAPAVAMEAPSGKIEVSLKVMYYCNKHMTNFSILFNICIYM